MTADTPESRAAYYREQADEVRRKAAQAEGNSRAVLLEVAATWGRLAELEQLLPQLSGTSGDANRAHGP
jgi:hypothetical protein